ncbi:MAG: inorganic phosphate transporter [Archangiaceae bacterium]|nr:inorganic phosphate transporter [Archangiaceae bacterium]
MVSLLIAVIIAAIIFDYINGFHDAANAIATVVSTGVLPIRTAVLIAAVLNFGGAITGTAVAKTIASGFADPAIVTQLVVLAALVGASVWNLFTWWFGIPSSSSHALIGGLAGAVVAHAGVAAFKWEALGKKVLLPLVLSPTIGFVVAFFVMIALVWVVRGRWPRPVLFGLALPVVGLLGWGLLKFSTLWDALVVSTWETRIAIAVGLFIIATVPTLYGTRPSSVQRQSRKLQLMSACLMAFSHGSNDAQKSMGIITLALLSFMASGDGSALPHWMLPKGDAVPLWVIVACASAIALGTAAGGTRIIKTMGTKIIRIVPLQGFAAEMSGALTILGASHLGVPVSTTHVINAAIMGVGASKRVSAVRWGVATNILVAWVLTLPLSAALAWLTMKLFALVAG